MRAERVGEWAWAPGGGPRRIGAGWWGLSPGGILTGVGLCWESVVGEFRLPWEGSWDVRGDHRCAVVAGAEGIALVDARGAVAWRAAHAGWAPRGGAAAASGTCLFDASGDLVWAVVPGERAGGGDELRVLGAADGRVLGRAVLGVETTGSAGAAVPGGGVLLDLATVHGGRICRARWDGERVAADVRDSPEEVLADLHPAGDRYLTAPMEADALTVRRLPGGGAGAVRLGEEVFPGGAGFDLDAGFLDAGRVLAREFDGPAVLLTAGGLDPVGEVAYPAGAVTGSLRPDGRGRWSTCDAFTGLSALWRLRDAGRGWAPGAGPRRC
ncbi:hypothetical protein [Nocardiopsis potens]|uniref:hypothetical protein n=1 Tax=Nocardiopsis potens TaxID=1246458 RepID=UPI000349569E|nr:hypothetical protein [Nocardiopsis potens]